MEEKFSTKPPHRHWLVESFDLHQPGALRLRLASVALVRLRCRHRIFRVGSGASRSAPSPARRTTLPEYCDTRNQPARLVTGRPAPFPDVPLSTYASAARLPS